MSNNFERAKSVIVNYLKYDAIVIMPCCDMLFYEQIYSLGENSKSLKILKPISIDDCILKRLKNGCNNIETPYFVIASDDDMLLVSGINQGIKYLDNNLEYSNYYGLTGRMLQKIPLFPLISFDYQNNIHNYEVNDFLNTFKRYRSYPLIYGINRVEVLNIFINLFPASKSNWEGIWELNLALAVALSGKSYYDDNSSYLLRLMHKSSRTSLQDFPELPSDVDNSETYTSKYINIKMFTEYINIKKFNLSAKEIIVEIFVDVISQCIYRNSYIKVPVFKINMLKFILLNFKKNIYCFVRKPIYLVRWFNFFSAALFYAKNRIH